MRRLIFPILLGVVGVAVLLGLGRWQLDRLAWKQDILGEIETRIADAPVALPDRPEPARDRYLPVVIVGQLAGDPLRVLISTEALGPAYRLIVPFQSATGRRIMVDLGAVDADLDLPDLPGGDLSLSGNLHWPDETDAFTPDPDGDLWFVRDVAAMAEVLETEPVMVIVREVVSGDLPTSLQPVDTATIPNDHLEYAITWFLLAAVWSIMSVLLIVRVARRGQSSA